ncbi:MAG TPA: DUF2889 domain-containing protein [Spirochaetota bacterium]|nr:DUF2889 domain-containing protein [Spirochaetota bacterium]
MSRLMELAGEAAHTRDMTFKTYKSGESHMITQCRLTDARLKDYYKLTGEKVGSGTLHDMEVVLLIKTPSLVIEDIEVAMMSVPRSDCNNVTKSLEPLIGLSVTRGFTANVRSLCGGIKGCTHLVTLLTAAGPAIVQGYLAVSYQKQTGEKSDRSKKGSGMLSYLKNTCYAWREDGDACRKLEDLIRGSKETGSGQKD